MGHDVNDFEPSVKFGEWRITFVIGSINGDDDTVVLLLKFSDESTKVF